MCVDLLIGKVKLTLSQTSALEGGGWSASYPGRFTPGKDPVPIVQGAGWAPGPVWTCAKNLAPNGIFLFQNILLKLTSNTS
jgi:hypothetical protein